MTPRYRRTIVLREISAAGGSFWDAAVQLGMTRAAVAGLAARNGIKFNSNTRGQRNSQAKLTAEQVLEIRRRFEAEPARALAQEFKVAPANIYAIVEGRSWKHLLPGASRSADELVREAS